MILLFSDGKSYRTLKRGIAVYVLYTINCTFITSAWHFILSYVLAMLSLVRYVCEQCSTIIIGWFTPFCSKILKSPDNSIVMSAICSKCRFHLPLRELHQHIKGCSPKNGILFHFDGLNFMVFCLDVQIALLDGECSSQIVVLTDADLCTLIEGCWLNDKVRLVQFNHMTSGQSDRLKCVTCWCVRSCMLTFVY